LLLVFLCKRKKNISSNKEKIKWNQVKTFIFINFFIVDGGGIKEMI